jgi:EAL domain-containing protein (putative c-di-GMP-specific phosphodiesterase class I)
MIRRKTSKRGRGVHQVEVAPEPELDDADRSPLEPGPGEATSAAGEQILQDCGPEVVAEEILEGGGSAAAEEEPDRDREPDLDVDVLEVVEVVEVVEPSLDLVETSAVEVGSGGGTPVAGDREPVDREPVDREPVDLEPGGSEPGATIDDVRLRSPKGPGEPDPDSEAPSGDPKFDGEPVLQFLPAVDLSTGLLLGFEALVRWRNPDGRLVMPDVLLPWAERNDYLSTLGAWVLEEACAQASKWPSGIQVAVNVSASELYGRISSQAATRALEYSGLNPDRLTIEVAEKVVSDREAREDLRALKQLGVNLAVDNVGASWSMIDNFRTFSIETAKIDREFIWGLEPDEGVNRVIVEAIIQMARSMAIGTVAEGIETPEQLWIVRKMGADVGQGYLFAKPLPSEEACELSNTAPRPVFSLPGPSDPGELEAKNLHVLR